MKIGELLVQKGVDVSRDRTYNRGKKIETVSRRRLNEKRNRDGETGS